MEINSLIKQVVAAAYSVHKELGHGFAEKVYEKSLAIALSEMGIEAVAQYPLTVHFHGHVVGEYIVDLLVEGELPVELKALTAIDSVHKSQVLNYLKACRRPLGLLINFGAPKLEINRLYNNDSRKI